MYTQKDELQALGPAYAARFYIAIFASFLLLVIVTFYRIANGCDGLGTVIFTLFFGFLIGALLVYQNNSLLGRDSTNLTGIPLLRERTRDGRPLYDCPQKTSETSP
jgi:RsiW-degrading membrane proteinase PrsW (M82 family)